MEHFYQNIQGWFGYQEFYSEIVKSASDNSHFVEVGTWKGTSAAFMAVEIINSGKKIKFDCVDTWEGSIEHAEYDCVKNKTLFEEFLKNIEPVKNYINPVKLPSSEAVKKYEDKSLDFVFIDAAHDYENVFLDVSNWYGKIKSGGILSGHDCFYPPVNSAINDFWAKLPEPKSPIKYYHTQGCWVLKI